MERSISLHVDVIRAIHRAMPTSARQAMARLIDYLSRIKKAASREAALALFNQKYISRRRPVR